LKIHLLSDLHLEQGAYRLPKDLKFDILVAAGDISPNVRQAMEFLKSIAAPVVMVLGNHDYWSGGSVEMADRLDEFRNMAAGSNVHVIENDSITLGDIRFLGCTLWTSFGKGNSDLMRIAWHVMNDFQQIRCAAWHEKNPGKLRQWLKNTLKTWHDETLHRHAFNPLAAMELHEQSLKWLRKSLQERPEGRWKHTVVVTHHAPLWQILETSRMVSKLEQIADPGLWAATPGLIERDRHNIYRLAAYASPLDKILVDFGRQVDFWCHGHVHARSDMTQYGIRFLCNPRGYAWGNGNAGEGFCDERFVFALEESKNHFFRGG